MPAREAFALAELIVVPSRAEAMPYIVLETLAAGKTDDRDLRRRHSGDFRLRLPCPDPARSASNSPTR